MSLRRTSKDLNSKQFLKKFLILKICNSLHRTWRPKTLSGLFTWKIKIINFYYSDYWGSEVVRSSCYRKNIGTEFTHLHIPLLCKECFEMRHNLGHSNLIRLSLNISAVGSVSLPIARRLPSDDFVIEQHPLTDATLSFKN